VIIWIIGLAGSGKTTLGKALYQKIKENNQKVCFIDGDSIRRAFNNDLGYSNKDRKINAGRIISFCKILDLQNINVVVSILHNFPDQRLKNKSIFSKYFEIFLDTPKKILLKRDQKKIYSKFKKKQIKNVVGLDIKFEKPLQPNITLNGNNSTKINVQKILGLINDKYIYDKSDYRANKELYFYSNAKESNFLQSFYKSRNEITKKVKKLKNKKNYKESSVLKYISKNFKNKKDIKGLCISYERNRKIYSSFYKNWKASEKKEIDLDNYILLSYYISKFLKKTMSLHVLNAFLKINDFICFNILNKKITLNKKILLNILDFEKNIIKKIYEKK
tara:strand:+ start:225 stop:1223 length:999 start_codon:yes stop_codon:yes gene_type:complete